MKHTTREGIVFECDSCSETLETETSNWADAKAMLDREGWKAHQIGNDWIHGCKRHAEVR